ncbi:hypothetical protein FAP39_16400 [Shimia litoralis]|uniref:Uncharacterized protein n=1 Tax=Shimia litoralis TaxID=420403 RepID=A0A4U7MT58_9RHOB|nr:hypothetical protein [Shimia litoralis]TKZ15887.1 hypothetical protein FAP39_16400 [Shimia litoralis]
MSHDYLSETPLLDYQNPAIKALIAQRGWAALSEGDSIGAAYDFVRNEVLFGYNSEDALPASKVLAEVVLLFRTGLRLG